MGLMNKAFENFTWKDAPNQETPLSADNLNKINNGLDTVDSRVVTLDTSMAGKENLGYITIGGTAYQVITSTTDAGTAGKITFVLEA